MSALQLSVADHRGDRRAVVSVRLRPEATGHDLVAALLAALPEEAPAWEAPGSDALPAAGAWQAAVPVWIGDRLLDLDGSAAEQLSWGDRLDIGRRPPSAPDDGDRWEVRATGGPSLGRWASLADGAEVLVGRHAGCDLVLEDATASRRHLVVRREGDRAAASDAGSMGGTLLVTDEGATARDVPSDDAEEPGRRRGSTTVPPGARLLVGGSVIDVARRRADSAVERLGLAAAADADVVLRVATATGGPVVVRVPRGATVVVSGGPDPRSRALRWLALQAAAALDGPLAVVCEDATSVPAWTPLSWLAECPPGWEGAAIATGDRAASELGRLAAQAGGPRVLVVDADVSWSARRAVEAAAASPAGIRLVGVPDPGSPLAAGAAVIFDVGDLPHPRLTIVSGSERAEVPDGPVVPDGVADDVAGDAARELALARVQRRGGPRESAGRAAPPGASVELAWPWSTSASGLRAEWHAAAGATLRVAAPDGGVRPWGVPWQVPDDVRHVLVVASADPRGERPRAAGAVADIVHAVVAGVAAHRSPGEVRVLLVERGAGPGDDGPATWLAALPHTAAVVDPSDAHELRRVLRHAAALGEQGPVVLAVPAIEDLQAVPGAAALLAAATASPHVHLVAGRATHGTHDWTGWSGPIPEAVRIHVGSGPDDLEVRSPGGPDLPAAAVSLTASLVDRAVVAEVVGAGRPRALDGDASAGGPKPGGLVFSAAARAAWARDDAWGAAGALDVPPPLPARLAPAEPVAGAIPIAVVDRPASPTATVAGIRCERPRSLLVTARSSEATSGAADAIAAAASLAGVPVVVLDGTGRWGDGGPVAAGAGARRAVLPAGDLDAVDTALDRLSARLSDPGGGRAAMVLVDGFDRLRHPYRELDGGRRLAVLRRLASDGRAAGVAVVVLGGADTLLDPIARSVDDRLVLGPVDAELAALAGLPTDGRAELPHVAGRGWWLGDDRPLEAQLFPPRTAPGGEEPVSDEAALGGTPAARGRAAADPPPPAVVIGDAPGGGSVAVDLDRGLLVAGPPGSGRSTALAGIAARATSGGRRVVALADRRDPAWHDSPAEVVDDPEAAAAAVAAALAGGGIGDVRDLDELAGAGAGAATPPSVVLVVDDADGPVAGSRALASIVAASGVAVVAAAGASDPSLLALAAPWLGDLGRGDRVLLAPDALTEHERRSLVDAGLPGVSPPGPQPGRGRLEAVGRLSRRLRVRPPS